ncbi:MULTISPECIES: DUF4044 domain-containing protein [Lactobacillaceae]|nr:MULTISPECIES: DUF4044 domain-containing protein [Lactobacillaceae]
MNNQKPKKSAITRITQVIIWLMIIVTLGGVILGAVFSFIN